MDFAMGLTAVALVYSPWGKRSGAHMNPAVTFTFWRLGKIAPWDAFFYVLAQFLGGISGVLLVGALLRPWVSHPAVNYAVTTPGAYGTIGAFFAELLISFVLMSVILTISNTETLARYTGLFAGALVATYIIFEAPISGMSMNPARTFGSAFSAHVWTAWWIYFTAPSWNAFGGGGVRAAARRAGSPLRQAAPPEQPALHFPLRLCHEGSFGSVGLP